MSHIIVIGSSNTDMVVKTNKFPVPGETILGGEFFMFSGGKGANQAVAAARMGSEVTFICKTGKDIFGQRSVEEFKKEGIHTNFIGIDDDKASGTALILVDDKGENEIVVASGANDTLLETNIEVAHDAIATADVVLLQLEIPVASVLYAAKKGHGLGTKVILNPAPAQILPEELFRYLYLITPNETEAEILTGIKVVDRNTAAKAAEKLIEMGVDNAIITMGSEGAYFKNHSLEMLVKAPVVKAVDTTAAGDVFNGVLAVGITQGKDWEESIAMACRAASISVTRMGAQASMPYRNEVEELEKLLIEK
jgi:ribokinase